MQINTLHRLSQESLLVTAAVWREPQLTVLISQEGVTSSRAGKAWIDMNTSSCLSPSCGSSPLFTSASWHKAPVQYSQWIWAITMRISRLSGQQAKYWTGRYIRVIAVVHPWMLKPLPYLYLTCYSFKQTGGGGGHIPEGDGQTCLLATLLLHRFPQTSRWKSNLTALIPAPQIKVTAICEEKVIWDFSFPKLKGS